MVAIVSRNEFAQTYLANNIGKAIAFVPIQSIKEEQRKEVSSVVFVGDYTGTEIEKVKSCLPEAYLCFIVKSSRADYEHCFVLPHQLQQLELRLLLQEKVFFYSKEIDELRKAKEAAERNANLYLDEINLLVNDLQYHSIALDQITSISAALLQTEDPDKLFALIALFAKKITDTSQCVIFLTNDRRLEVAFAEDSLPKGRLLQLLQEENVFSSVLSTKESLKIEESQQHPLLLKTPGIRRFLGIPLLQEGEIVGALTVFDMQSQSAFKETDEFMLRAMATLALTAQKNLHTVFELKSQHLKLTRAYNELTVTLKDLQYHSVIVDQIRNVSKNIYAELTLDKIITVIAEDVRNLTDAAASIVIIKTKKEGYDLYSSGISFSDKAKQQLMKGENIYRRTIQENKTSFFDKFPLEMQSELPIEHPRIENFISVPVSSDMETSGVIAVINNEEGFKETHQYLIYALSDVTSTALQNSNLLNDLHERVHELSRLNDFSLALNSLETEKVIDVITSQIGSIINDGGQRVSLARLSPDRTSIRYLFVASPEEVAEGFEEKIQFQDIGPLQESYATKQTIIIHNVNSISQYEHIPLWHHPAVPDIRSLLTAPVIADGKVVGFLIATSDQEYAFQENKKHLLTILANQISTALVNADLYENMREKVRERVAEIDKKNAELEQSYHELQQTQTQLIQSERMNAIGMMVSGVMHEINNPTAAIAAAVDAAIETTLRLKSFLFDIIPSEQADTPEVRQIDEFLTDIKDTLSVAVEGTDRVSSIVSTLRSFNKHQEADLQLGDLSVELESTIKLFKYQFKDVEIEFVGARPGEMQIIGNIGEINQLFLNLFVNAAQANAQRISVSLKKNEQHIVLTIVDNGCGMSEEVQSKIYEPFFSTRGPGNSGLGLHLCKQILDRHQAVIVLESEEGVGTTFEIFFPIPTKSDLERYFQ